MKNKYYISIFLLFGSLIFGQFVRIPVFGKIILVSDIAIVIFLIFWSLKLREKIKKIYEHYLFKPISFFIFFSVLSLIIALPNLGIIKVITASLYLARWILYVLTAFIISWLPDQAKAKKSVFWGIMGLGLLLSIAGFIQLKIYPDFAPMVKYGWDPHKNRLLSTWFDPNLLASFLMISLSFLAAHLIFYLDNSVLRYKIQDTRYKNFNFQNWNLNFFVSCFLEIASCLLIYLAAVLTYSRSGYLALGAVFITICILKFNWKFFIAGLIIAPLTLAFFPRSLKRVSGAAAVDVTSQMRIDSWNDGWGIIKRNPVFGTGFNTLQWQWNKNHPEHASSGCDSSLLTIWATTGFFGLLSYLWIIWKILKNKYLIFKSDKDTFNKIFALGSIAAIIGIIIHSTFVNSLLYPHIMLVLWTMA